jgi:hypothetical protein
MGVNEFNAPAKELSIFCSAIQNKYAGIKLPNTPEKNIRCSFLKGICLNPFIAIGSKNKPEHTILTDAT